MQTDYHIGPIEFYIVQRVIVGGRVTDDFRVSITINTSDGETLTGSTILDRAEENRLHEFFMNTRYVEAETDGPMLVIVVDHDVNPMPAFRLDPVMV